jgi:hypothetical protein
MLFRRGLLLRMCASRVWRYLCVYVMYGYVCEYLVLCAGLKMHVCTHFCHACLTYTHRIMYVCMHITFHSWACMCTCFSCMPDIYTHNHVRVYAYHLPSVSMYVHMFVMHAWHTHTESCTCVCISPQLIYTHNHVRVYAYHLPSVSLIKRRPFCSSMPDIYTQHNVHMHAYHLPSVSLIKRRPFCSSIFLTHLLACIWGSIISGQRMVFFTSTPLSMDTCMYVYLYVCMYVYMYLYVCMYMSVGVHAWMHGSIISGQRMVFLTSTPLSMDTCMWLSVYVYKTYDTQNKHTHACVHTPGQTQTQLIPRQPCNILL